MADDSLHHLSGDAGTREYRLWRKWLRHAVTIRAELRDWSEQIGPDDDFDPFRYNETASVATLASAASRAGFPTLTEFCGMKLRAKRGGRCDLWIGDPSSHRNWAIEFKQLFAKPALTKRSFTKLLDKACENARDVSPDEAAEHLGAVVMVIDRDHLTGKVDVEALVSRIDGFCCDCFIAFRIGSDARAIWFAFQHARRA